MFQFAMLYDQGLAREAMDIATRLEPRYHHILADFLMARQGKELIGSLYGLSTLEKLEIEITKI
jgi:hypothetical protein